MPGVHRNQPRKKDSNSDENLRVSDKKQVSSLVQVLRDRRQPIPKGPPKDEESKTVFFANLIRLREEGMTIEKCALELGVCEKSVRNYMDEPLYKELQEHMISDSKQTGHLMISEVIPMAVEGLVEIANDMLVSPFVRFKCFEVLLNYAGFNEPRDTVKTDARSDVAKFLREVEESKRQQAIYNIQNVNVNTQGQEKGEENIVDSIPEGIPQELIPYYEPVLEGGKLPLSFTKDRKLPSPHDE